MPKFDDYTQKTAPEDTDIALILDKTANVNKKTPFSGIWTWIVNKMTNAVIQNLQTTNKTVIGSINELNSNVASGVLKEFGIGDIDIDISGFPSIILLSACNYLEGAIFLIRKETNDVFCLSVVPCDSFSLVKKDNNTITFSNVSSAGGNLVLFYKN